MTATKPIRVVLADDHTMLRQSLRKSLEDRGLTIVAEAGNGEEAVEAAVAHNPDVVLMDLTMPVMDGVTATRTIRSRHPNINVVVLTMHADESLLADAVKAGAAAYLVKDCSMSEVVDTIEKVVSGEVLLSPDIARSALRNVQEQEHSTSNTGPVGNGEQIITNREAEVLQLIAEGSSTVEVAEQLYISPKTVKNHLASIFQKLDARDRTQAVLSAVKLGIVHLD